MKITEEEHRVYMSYTCGIGGGFSSQDWNYEILNERRTISGVTEMKLKTNIPKELCNLFLTNNFNSPPF